MGVIAALLLAPEAGRTLRDKLGSRYDDIRSMAEDFLEEVKEKGSDACDHLEGWKDTLNEVVSKLSSRKVRNQCRSKVDEILDWAS